MTVPRPAPGSILWLALATVASACFYDGGLHLDSAASSGSDGASTAAASTTTTTTTALPTDPATGGASGPTTALTTGPGVCGDGVVDPGEECDDGNRDDGDSCLATCIAAS
ncbi:MAG TPA: hypothetical protein VIK91_05150, partial [Nannocystis sp.]